MRQCERPMCQEPSGSAGVDTAMGSGIAFAKRRGLRHPHRRNERDRDEESALFSQVKILLRPPSLSSITHSLGTRCGCQFTPYPPRLWRAQACWTPLRLSNCSHPPGSSILCLGTQVPPLDHHLRGTRCVLPLEFKHAPVVAHQFPGTSADGHRGGRPTFFTLRACITPPC